MAAADGLAPDVAGYRSVWPLMLLNTTDVTLSEVLFKTTVTTLGWVPITIVVVLVAVVAQLTGPLML